jgi:hypothetical protein
MVPSINQLWREDIPMKHDQGVCVVIRRGLNKPREKRELKTLPVTSFASDKNEDFCSWPGAEMLTYA